MVKFSQKILRRSDAGDSSGADKLYKKASECRKLFKPLLANVVNLALGKDNSMSDDVLDNLLHRSDILSELIAMQVSRKNNDRSGFMSALSNLLTYLGKAR